MSEQKNTTTEELAAFVQAQQMPSKTDRDIRSLRYVTYVRKSTNEDGKQERSLEDQLTECEELSERLDLNVVRVIQEKASAKEPDIRPLYRKMIDGLEKGTYDGVISWHPNRLARNMRDAGEIIDLLDKDVIKDLQFVAHSFQNDSSGKMLLGITFVMAKQYSDDLSKVVKRGNAKSVEDGKYPNKAKWGYKKDRNGYLQPDGKNFTLMQEAFRMRLQGTTLDDISSWLNNNEISRTNTQSGRTYAQGMNKKKLSLIFKDPAYAGVVKYGDQVTDITQTYDFTAIITPNEFMKINKTDKQGLLKLASPRARKSGARADLLRGCVMCSTCGDSLNSGISSNKKGGVLRYYYRCENKDCPVLDKSVRPRVILNFIEKYFDLQPFSSPEAFTHYKKEVRRVVSIRTEKNRKNLRMKKKLYGETMQYFEALKKQMAVEQDEERRKNQDEANKKTKTKLNTLHDEIEKLEGKIRQTSRSIDTYEEFLELFKNMPKTLKVLGIEGDPKKLDSFIKKFFSNFVVDQKNVISYTLNAPFGALERLNDIEVLDGGC